MADYIVDALAVVGGVSLFLGIAAFGVMGIISIGSLVRRALYDKIVGPPSPMG